MPKRARGTKCARRSSQGAKRHALANVDVRAVDGGHVIEVDEKARRAAGKAVRGELGREVAHGAARLQHRLAPGRAVADHVEQVVLADLDASQVCHVHHARGAAVLDDDALAGLGAQARAHRHGLERALEVELEGVPLDGLHEKAQGGDLVAVDRKLLEVGAEDDDEALVGLADRGGELHAGHAGHVNVQVEDVEQIVLVGKVCAGAGVRADLELQVLLGGKALYSLTDLATGIRLVVDDSNPYHCSSPLLL